MDKNNLESSNNNGLNINNDFNINLNLQNDLIENKTKTKNKKILNKKLKKPNKIIKVKNPGITHFNLSSHFFYDLSDTKTYLNLIGDKNSMKLNKKELSVLEGKIKTISNEINEDSNNKIIELSLNDLNNINNYFNFDYIEEPIVTWLREYIKKENKKENISLKKIINVYYNETGETISKTKLYYIFKNKLNLSYLKTNVKTSERITPNSIFSCHCFIKIIVRAINLGFEIFFMDESSILKKNNNFKCWRYSKELIHQKSGPNRRSNLLLIVDNKSIIFYKINKESTNQKTFLAFMQEFLKIIKTKEQKPFILVMDNLAVHKTAVIRNFLIENKINVLFITPYMSEFNCAEFTFRYLKRHLYNNLYRSLEDAENDVKILLEDERINRTLLKNYRETLETYLKFSFENQFKNLNGLDYKF